MSSAAFSPALAAQARRFHVDLLLREWPRVVKAVVQRAHELPAQVTQSEQVMRARDASAEVPRLAPAWQKSCAGALQAALVAGQQAAASARGAPFRPGSEPRLELSLVGDETIEQEIIASRLALALMDKASWEFSDLRYRMAALDQADEMPAQDVLRPHVLARAVVEGWQAAGLSLEIWQSCQGFVHEECANLLHEAYHELNRWLVQQGVCTEVNLRAFIRRSRDGGSTSRAAHLPGASLSGGLSAPAGAAAIGGNSVGAAGRWSGGASVEAGGGAAPGSAGGLGVRPEAGVAGGRTPVGSGGAAPAGAAAPTWGAATGAFQKPSARYPTPTSVQQRHRVTPENAHQFAPTQPAVAAGMGGISTVRGDGTGSPVQEETRLMTRFPGLLRSMEQAEAVLGRLNRLVSRQVPDFAGSTLVQPHVASPGLKAAINDAQLALKKRFLGVREGTGGAVAGGGAGAAGSSPAAEVPQLSPQAAVSTPGLLQELQARKQILKKAATTPVERATIEIVALMFQSLLTEERLPSAIRVWFARLQMPVLRVAIVEPDFFATIDHPARKLIDRMGACVMGFEAGSAAGVSEALEKEVKRVVQVVEAYPDTGRRVFQTVLTEFERFIENYFKTAHAAASKGVSLAQQIEQRETLAIQYTIELRKMLQGVPVHDGVREFLFHVWADVLATSGVKTGAASELTKQMQRAAADLVWLAGAKVSREERAEAIRRLPPLLKKLREGMVSAGVPVAKQDEYIQALNNALASAFSARTATIPPERMGELKMQLETLEEMLPDLGTVEIDEDMIRDLSEHDSSDLEVIADGGSMPSPAMLAWATEIKVGAWFKLDHSGRVEPVQLAWLGMRQHLSLFVTTQGRAVMFQKHRLASYLQAGLLVPAEEEALTVRATREALAKLDAEPDRLLN